jgi:hypothetical protein
LRRRQRREEEEEDLFVFNDTIVSLNQVYDYLQGQGPVLVGLGFRFRV